MNKRIGLLVIVAILALMPAIAQEASSGFPTHPLLPEDAKYIATFDEYAVVLVFVQYIGPVAVFTSELNPTYEFILGLEGNRYGNMRIYSRSDGVMWSLPANGTVAMKTYLFTGSFQVNDIEWAYEVWDVQIGGDPMYMHYVLKEE